MRKVLKDQLVGFIGAGNIAEAMARGLIRSGLLDPGNIIMSARNAERLGTLAKTLGVQWTIDNKDVARQADFLFLTVKPGTVAEVAQEISAAISQKCFVVSVAAGIPIAYLVDHLANHRRTLRIMPNLPCNVRDGTIALCPGPELEDNEVLIISTLLGALGEVVMVEQEEWLDAITALSGSAPAYYVMMATALIRFGVEQGMPADLSSELILSTLRGSAQWALESKIDPKDLWPKVVTPGGITEAGMKVFESRDFLDIFVEGLRKATERAQEISRQYRKK